eukprot:1178582-Prorocentrum_minimum.AAC.4
MYNELIRDTDKRHFKKNCLPPRPAAMRAAGVDSGTEGVDLGIQGVDSGTEGVDLGIQGVDSGTAGVELGIEGACVRYRAVYLLDCIDQLLQFFRVVTDKHLVQASLVQRLRDHSCDIKPTHTHTHSLMLSPSHTRDTEQHHLARAAYGEEPDWNADA